MNMTSLKNKKCSTVFKHDIIQDNPLLSFKNGFEKQWVSMLFVCKIFKITESCWSCRFGIWQSLLCSVPIHFRVSSNLSRVRKMSPLSSGLKLRKYACRMQLWWFCKAFSKKKKFSAQKFSLLSKKKNNNLLS